MFDEERLATSRALWNESLERLIRPLPEFQDVIKDLKSFFWPEVELAAFKKDGNSEHLREIARDEGARFVLSRALLLINNKLKSNKLNDVRVGLLSFADLWEYQPENTPLHQEMRRISTETIEHLSKDPDKEIRKKAGAVFEMMKH